MRFSLLKSLLKSENAADTPPPESPESDGNHTKISLNLEENLKACKQAFKNCSDVVYREIFLGEGVPAFLIFIDGIVKSEDISDQTIRPLLVNLNNEALNEPAAVEETTLLNSDIKREDTFDKIIDAVLTGHAVLFIDEFHEAFLINARGGTRRSVDEPATEAVIRGPREGFIENLRTNTALIRFKIKSNTLKFEPFVIGKKTKTNVVLAYMEGIADPKVIEEARKRLDSIEIDGVLESGYIEEFIEDDPFSPFPQMHYTERPDTVAAHLLEGRFAIFVDGTPFVIMAPTTVWEFLQSSEDYYERFGITNLIRGLRYLFVFLALFLPALYIAITTFHQDMLPTSLLLSIASARESIPFPALVEALIMEFAFEALREAGVRLPKTVGQAVSILGALVIGQAAVQAGIVSAPMVIVVSLTGIASFTIPRFSMAISLRLLRFPLMIIAGVFGLFGIIIATVWIAVHLCELRSFGVPYLSGIAPYKKNEMKDIFIRVPWWRMVVRPGSYAHNNRKRMDEGLPPSSNRSKG